MGDRGVHPPFLGGDNLPGQFGTEGGEQLSTARSQVDQTPACRRVGADDIPVAPGRAGPQFSDEYLREVPAGESTGFVHPRTETGKSQFAIL